MLKRNLVKKSIGSILLLAIVAINTAGTPLFSTDTADHTGADSSAIRVSFDPVMLKLNGLPETEIVNAPAIQLNKKVKDYVEDYVSLYSHTLKTIKEKKGPYFTFIDSVFTKYGLPVELKYVAVIESQLMTKQVSKAGAVGAWQFMPVTARTFSLKVTPGHDERINFYKSTVAAAKYFKYLHKMFDDWLLVIAAYNGGPGVVYKAIKKSGSRNFWKLQDYLPAESRIHVKKFISTHYYYEGTGSITTLTKDEATKYTTLMMDFVAKQNEKSDNQEGDNDEPVAKISHNAEIVMNDEEE
jgi:peptidoglycan lytic transglycosylase D